MWERLQERRFRGAIVGPCGSGKTCLLEHLYKRFQKSGDAVLWLEGKRLTSVTTLTAEMPPDTKILFINSFEAVPRVLRFHLWRRIPQDVGLIVTAHRTMLILPTLYRTSVDGELVRQLIADLCREKKPSSLTVEKLLLDQGPNVRNIFRALYDDFARQQG